MASSRSALAPTALEREHVHDVYDAIAPHFSHTRHRPWPLVVQFLTALEPAALVADVGCGNAKYLRVNPSLCVVGLDRSLPLLKSSSVHGDETFNLVGCDALNVPLRTGAFDAAISIAVLHHISNVERRLALISELARIVRVGGSIFIVAWAFEQDESSKRQFEEQDVMVEWKLQEKFVESTTPDGAEDERATNAKKDPAKRWVVYQRYCHVYKRGELEDLVNQVPGLQFAIYDLSTSIPSPPTAPTELMDDIVERNTVGKGGDSNDENHHGISSDRASIDSPEGEGQREGDYEDGDIDVSEEEEESSGAETQRVGNRALRFARHCVKSGEYSKAITALMNVVEISDLTSVSCRQAQFFAAQIFSVTGQEDIALKCLMDVWDNMPPPYCARDAQLLMMAIHERLGRVQFALFWYKKAFGSYPAPTAAAFDTWLDLANRSFHEGDCIVAKEAFTRAFACVFETQTWPSNLNVFCFVNRFLLALTSVRLLRGDNRFHRQQVAFSLALQIADLIDASRLADHAFDDEYLSLRCTYALQFPSIYNYLFKEEDHFVGRICRAWRVYQARRVRRQAFPEQEERLQESKVSKAPKKPMKKIKKKQQCSKAKQATENPEVIVDHDQLRFEQIREKTRARILAQRAARSIKSLSPQPPPRHSPQPKSPDTIRSPTRRKIENVKQLRDKAGYIEEDLPLPSTNQGPTSPNRSHEPSLLDVYKFPSCATHRRQFEADAGRAPRPADLDNDLDEIEAFARMAHYRSRVLVNQHQAVHDPRQMNIDMVTPIWLRQLNDLVLFVESQQTRHHVPGVSVTTARSHFSEIHARVVAQLRNIHSKYSLLHGKTMFTKNLSRLTNQIETWQFKSVEDEVLVRLRSIKSEGEREESHRNLEFYHALQLRK